MESHIDRKARTWRQALLEHLEIATAWTWLAGDPNEASQQSGIASGATIAELA